MCQVNFCWQELGHAGTMQVSWQATFFPGLKFRTSCVSTNRPGKVWILSKSLADIGKRLFWVRVSSQCLTDTGHFLRSPLFEVVKPVDGTLEVCGAMLVTARVIKIPKGLPEVCLTDQMEEEEPEDDWFSLDFEYDFVKALCWAERGMVWYEIVKKNLRNFRVWPNHGKTM